MAHGSWLGSSLIAPSPAAVVVGMQRMLCGLPTTIALRTQAAILRTQTCIPTMLVACQYRTTLCMHPPPSHTHTNHTPCGRGQVPCPNAVSHKGLNHDKQCFNPDRSTPTHLRRYTFWGKLAGMCAARWLATTAWSRYPDSIASVIWIGLSMITESLSVR